MPYKKKEWDGGSLGGAMQLFLALPVHSDERRAELKALGVQPRYMTNRMAMAAALAQAAAAGDVRAGKLVMDLLEDDSVQKVSEGVKILDDL